MRPLSAFEVAALLGKLPIGVPGSLVGVRYGLRSIRRNS
jgi:hypothetical protein